MVILKSDKLPAVSVSEDGYAIFDLHMSYNVRQLEIRFAHLIRKEAVGGNFVRSKNSLPKPK